MQYIAMYFDNSYAIVAQLSSSYGSWRSVPKPYHLPSLS
jgi:hypothetical protein